MECRPRQPRSVASDPCPSHTGAAGGARSWGLRRAEGCEAEAGPALGPPGLAWGWELLIGPNVPFLWPGQDPVWGQLGTSAPSPGPRLRMP